MHSTPSLFVIALPRSLSTVVYEHCATALGLRVPAWTSAGEILNGDRLVLSGTEQGSLKFTPPERSVEFTRVLRFLDDVVQPTGVAYKDVVQPFATAQWLRDKNLPVLHLRRPLADIALSFERAGWRYPIQAAPAHGDETERLLRGLQRAARVLASVKAATLDFDTAVDDDDALRRVLQPLYPQRELPPIHYRDDAFLAYARTVRERRAHPRWLLLDERLRALDADVTVD